MPSCFRPVLRFKLPTAIREGKARERTWGTAGLESKGDLGWGFLSTLSLRRGFFCSSVIRSSDRGAVRGVGLFSSPLLFYHRPRGTAIRNYKVSHSAKAFPDLLTIIGLCQFSWPIYFGDITIWFERATLKNSTNTKNCKCSGWGYVLHGIQKVIEINTFLTSVFFLVRTALCGFLSNGGFGPSKN